MYAMVSMKLWFALFLPGIIPDIMTVFALPEDANLRKSQPQQDNLNGYAYENYSENMIPLLSRDFTLLGQAIEMINDAECRNQCKSMMAGIHNLTSWAARFYDASGKFPEGILGGSLYQLGNFDECLQIGQADNSPPGVHGQYCLGEVGIGVPNLYLNRNGTIWDDFRPSPDRSREIITKLHWGICVPAACEPHDVEDVVRTVLAVAFSGSHLKLTPKIPYQSCYKRTTPSYNNLEIAYTCMILSLISLLIVGTTFHIKYISENKKVPGGLFSQMLLGFSIIFNVKKLCKGTQASDVNLACVSGIKVIAMGVILAGHSLMFSMATPVLNLKFWQEIATHIEYSAFINNPLLVDTFLLLGGFLVSCMILNQLSEGRPINFFYIYVLRYMRLTPAYFVIVGLYMTWFPRLDSGPMWSRIYLEKDRCLSSWWTNLLYINNYVNTDNLCMFQSWYLSVDTQLFFLAPLVIYPLHKWRRIGELILASVTIVATVIPFVTTLGYSLDPTLMVYSAELKDISTNNFFINSYIKTHMRASSYCFGLACGYIVHRVHQSGYKLSPNAVRLGWLFASLSLVSSMTSIVVFYGPRCNYTPLESAFYAALHRAFWSLGTGWVVLACVTGNGGIVAKILEWRFFSPLSRLTYSAYLVNGMVELYNVATTRSPQYLSKFSLMRSISSDVVLTVIGALVLCIMCESPILGLEKILLSKGRKKTKRDEKGESEDTNTTEA